VRFLKWFGDLGGGMGDAYVRSVACAVMTKLSISWAKF
jgi:hypothetical protein